MKISEKDKKSISSRLVKSYLALTAIFGLGSLVYFASLDMIPAQYLLGYGVLLAVSTALGGLLLIKKYVRLAWLARLFGYIITLVFVALTIFAIAVTRTVHSSLSVMSNENSSEAVKVSSADPFNVYISGIDSYGDLSVQSRSDVNILATVNPGQKKVLLTTVPRDAYVPIALGGNNQKDKLTHAGNYGVESSMKTVGNIFGQDVKAYVRINFTSFIEGIDKIGGITVSNPMAFNSYGEHFPAGELELNGKRALVFSRERKTLQGGDVDRGKNQQRVIEGVVKKMSSIRSIDGFNNVLSIVNSSVQTNLSTGSIKQLVSSQLANPGEWTTESYSIEGKGQTGGLPSYAMPNHQLYMYVLDDMSVAKAKAMISKTLSK